MTEYNHQGRIYDCLIFIEANTVNQFLEYNKDWSVLADTRLKEFGGQRGWIYVARDTDQGKRT